MFEAYALRGGTLIGRHRLRRRAPRRRSEPGSELDQTVAIAKAQDLAGYRTVAVNAGEVGSQILAAGLVDEVAMDVVPVVSGRASATSVRADTVSHRHVDAGRRYERRRHDLRRFASPTCVGAPRLAELIGQLATQSGAPQRPARARQNGLGLAASPVCGQGAPTVPDASARRSTSGWTSRSALPAAQCCVISPASSQRQFSPNCSISQSAPPRSGPHW